jgi:hypothetical protein
MLKVESTLGKTMLQMISQVSNVTGHTPMADEGRKVQGAQKDADNRAITISASVPVSGNATDS